MSASSLSAVTFLGAVIGDLMALAAAMRTGRIDSKRWKRPVTYAGVALQGTLACLVRAVLFRGSSDAIFAFSIGANLPLFLEKLAAISPRLASSSLPRDAGFSGSDSRPLTPTLEQMRQLLAKER
jgi:hypothetical protein